MDWGNVGLVEEKCRHDKMWLRSVSENPIIPCSIGIVQCREESMEVCDELPELLGWCGEIKAGEKHRNIRESSKRDAGYNTESPTAAASKCPEEIRVLILICGYM